MPERDETRAVPHAIAAWARCSKSSREDVLLEIGERIETLCRDLNDPIMETDETTEEFLASCVAARDLLEWAARTHGGDHGGTEDEDRVD